ncbi:MAG: helix-turn-helix transcriptional regulator [Lachnospiraceae bacterium]|nr:helix-turn-helix transcriptional regulator [Lachnospiraceae bacterium]
MDREAVGLKIKLARVKENLTQEQLAERADISSSYVSAIERGKQSVSLEYMNRIAEALQVPVTELLAKESGGYVTDAESASGMRDRESEYEGKYITRQKKMNQINEMLSRCGDREFQIAYDEISLLMNKFQYLNDKGIK